MLRASASLRMVEKRGSTLSLSIWEKAFWEMLASDASRSWGQNLLTLSRLMFSSIFTTAIVDTLAPSGEP